MIKPIPVGRVVDYVLPEDKENPTIWKIAALGSIFKSDLLMKSIDVETELAPAGKEPKITIKPKGTEESLSYDLGVVKFGLKGFSNFKLNGAEVPFKTNPEDVAGVTYQVVTRETLEYIPREIISKLSVEIYNISEVSEGEEKN